VLYTHGKQLLRGQRLERVQTAEAFVVVVLIQYFICLWMDGMPVAFLGSLTRRFFIFIKNEEDILCISGFLVVVVA
jgi:hypothetical protein